MNLLMLINAIGLGFIGSLFAVYGNNAQSRILGLAMLTIAAFNAAGLVGVIPLQ